ncbi:MAG: ThuA domain-containing protein [Sphingobacteriaceae bacterium]
MTNKFPLKWPGLLLAMVVLISFSCNKRSGTPKILVFSKTAGFHHESIPAGNAALIQLGAGNGFQVDTTTNPDYFTDDSLKKYSAVVFLSATGNLLNNYQEAAFERYIQSGGGFVGIHAAADAEYDWGWYGRLVGGYFKSHPKQQEAVLNVVDASHPSTEHLPKDWRRKDEWYNFKKLSKDIKVLIKIDEKSYEGGENGNDHPMAWYHDFDGGRSFYTELGHTDESFSDSLYLKHVLGGIKYAIGGNKELDYDKAKTFNVPEEDRFVKTVLSEGALTEPTEMAILPNLDILVSQRRGELMLYSQSTKEVKQVGLLDVYWQSGVEGVNAEEGLLGLTVDPDFKSNNYVYLFYSPVDTSVNRLSRFEFKNNVLDKESEKVILEFYSQRGICCHTGGSLTFGNDHELFLSAGDNSTPFDEPNQKFVNHGFAPLNDEPGHMQYDARRSSGNSNDLRGKILRIKINKDGSYSIPEGNLFAKGQEKTRPEIYVMGNRNPYRIAFDKKSGYLYWGEVGPDASSDSLETRGSRGYDEVNQARKAGFFGWPLFVGNNYPYHEYNYVTGQSGQAFDPEKPLNNSRNNTGLRELPPAQPAFVYYPYGESVEFPQVGGGGRNAMAGPVYHTDLYPKETRYPDYYDGKFFMYDWIRNWIKAVTMLPNGDFDKMEPFMEHTSFASISDMEVGPDGRIYVLEYGKGWFSKNPDAGISRLDYLSGNRPPKAGKVTVEKLNGRLPFTVSAKVEASDPENDKLTYVWKIGDVTKETTEPSLTYIITKAGDYNISAEVLDAEKASSGSNVVTVYAGNEEPQVDVILKGNQSFYFPGKSLAYEVKVTDGSNKIDANNLFISADYIQGTDLAGASLGHQQVSEAIMGKNMMMSSDCQSCHKLNEKGIGPSFTQVADKYKKDPGAMAHLTQKIIKGGSGVWGEVAMPAHPTLKEGEVKQMVTWVLSLTKEANTKKSLPLKGDYIPKPDVEHKQNTVFALTASYTDLGGAGIKPLSSSKALYLRSNLLDAGSFTSVSGFSAKDSSGVKYFVFPDDEGRLKITNVDLTGVSKVEISGLANGRAVTYLIAINLDHMNGINMGNIGVSKIVFGDNKSTASTNITLKEGSDGKMHDVYMSFKSTSPGTSQKPLLKTIRFIAE